LARRAPHWTKGVLMILRMMELLENAKIASTYSLFNGPEGRPLGFGTTVGNGIEGWAPGALFVHTDGSGLADLAYVNYGSITTATWYALPVGLGAVAAGAGASLVGVEDSAGHLIGATAEAAIAELAGLSPSESVVEFFDDFLGTTFTHALVPPPWVLIDTSAAGAPTLGPSADQHAGALACTHAADDEAEAIGIDFGNELCFDIDQLLTFECRFRAPTLTAVDEIVIGMIGDQNDAPASLTIGAWISVDGNQDIDCESDDTATRLDDQDSTINLGNDVWCSLKIDFSTKAAVKFYLDATGAGAYARVLPAVVFDLSTVTTGLQPAMFLTKSGGATTQNLDIDFVRILADRS